MIIDMNKKYPPPPLWAKIVGWTLIAIAQIKAGIIILLLTQYKTANYPTIDFLKYIDYTAFTSLGFFIIVQHYLRKEKPKFFWSGIVLIGILFLLPFSKAWLSSSEAHSANISECKKLAQQGELKDGISIDECAKRMKN